jgi:ADP-ribose pyrophosphatase YjhB (NUDIX family)
MPDSISVYRRYMARIDYVDDPGAPEANSVVPSVVAIVRDDAGRVLLIHKTDNNLWALPGGGHEIGESIVDTVVREVKEETGYDVEVETITGTYTNPGHVMAYDDGEVRQQFSIAFRARLIGGDAQTSSESSEVVWARPEEIDALQMHPSMRLRIRHALEERSGPHLG